jgi:hypothetical protein
MNTNSQLQIWDVWYSQAGATGIPFARGRLQETNSLLVHAPPPVLTVEVRNNRGQRLAFARDLEQTARIIPVILRVRAARRSSLEGQDICTL